MVGQHIIAGKKEIYEEAAVGKDTCMCAVYMGVTEEEKMDLALHNATLHAIPFNVLDVVRLAFASYPFHQVSPEIIHLHTVLIFPGIVAAEVPRC